MTLRYDIPRPSNCMSCPNKSVIPDPDPNDWFCDDDRAVVCQITPNPKRKADSKYQADRSPHRIVTCSCRPYKLKEESATPEWCPLSVEVAA